MLSPLALLLRSSKVEQSQKLRDLLSAPAPLLSPPFSSLLIRFDKPLYGTVIRLLYIVGENARRKLPHPQMVLKTFTAVAFLITGFIATVALRQIFLNVAFFHIFSPSSKNHFFNAYGLSTHTELIEAQSLFKQYIRAPVTLQAHLRRI